MDKINPTFITDDEELLTPDVFNVQSEASDEPIPIHVVKYVRDFLMNGKTEVHINPIHHGHSIQFMCPACCLQGRMCVVKLIDNETSFAAALTEHVNEEIREEQNGPLGSLIDLIKQMTDEIESAPEEEETKH